jgi:F-type H+-transporting ATPase subunit b
MPQLDITTYSSQIFWFFLCFITLYLFTSCVILPRIRNIQKNRKSVIDADLSAAADLDEKIYQLQMKTDALRKDAASKYQVKLEEVSKDAAKQREKLIEELKEKIDEITQKSRAELKEFIAKSDAQSEIEIKSLSQKIREKFFNKELASNLSKE